MAIYYVTPIIGTGTRADPFRTKIDQYGINHSTVIPTNSTTGQPLFTWALTAVPTGANTTQIDADATIDKLPITNLDQTIGALTNQQRNTLRSIGTKYGVTRIAGLTNTDTCRDALNAMGQALDPNFDASTFDVI